MNQNPIAIYPVTIYTDGSCLRNPGGAGGWSAILIFGDGQRQEISGGVRSTTNNRMELMAAIMAIQSLPNRSVIHVYTDASYLVDGYPKVLARRISQSRGGKWWKNLDLWNRLLDVCASHDPSFRQVRGHCGNPNNERADKLAGRAARAKDRLECDEGYEKTVITRHGGLVRLANNVDHARELHARELHARELHAGELAEHEKFRQRYQQILNAPRIEQLILACDAD